MNVLLQHKQHNVCLLLGALLWAFGPAARAQTVAVDLDAIDAPIGACGSGALVRAFDVQAGGSLPVGAVRLGFRADHPYRGDLQATLTSPGGTAVVVIGGIYYDDHAHFDVLLDDTAVSLNLTDGDDDDPAAPFYDRRALPSEALDFAGENGDGTWVLEVCDTYPGLDDGTMRSARLEIDAGTPSPDLRLRKFSSERPVVAGDTITFIIEAANSGTATAQDVRVTDDLHATVELVPNTLAVEPAAGTAGYEPGPPRRVTWRGDLAPGEVVRIRFKAVVTTTGYDVVNTAQLAQAGLDAPVYARTVSDYIFHADKQRVFNETPEDGPLPIPDAGLASGMCAVSTIRVPDVDLLIDQVDVGVTVAHPNRGDLVVELTSPQGTRVVLLAETGAFEPNLNAFFCNSDPLFCTADFRFGPHGTDPPLYSPAGVPQGPGAGSLDAFRTQAADGTWTLKICDARASDAGVLMNWSLRFAPLPTTSRLSMELFADRSFYLRGQKILYTLQITNSGGGDEGYFDWQGVLDIPPEGSELKVVEQPSGPNLHLQVSTVAMDGGFVLTIDGKSGIPALTTYTWRYEVLTNHAGLFDHTAELDLSPPITTTEVVQVFYVDGPSPVANDVQFFRPKRKVPDEGQETAKLLLTLADLFADEGGSMNPGGAPSSLSYARNAAADPPLMIEDLEVGLNLDHAYRGDLRVVLEAPDGTQVEILSADGNSRPHYDLLLDDEAAGPIDDGDGDDPDLPLFERRAAPNNPLSAFDGRDATGTWTLYVYDTDAGIEGTLNAWALFVDVDEAALPVELAGFEAVADGDDVLLTWTTASERNNAGFTVETRREEAPWQALAFVEGHGTTRVVHAYTHRVEGLAPGPHRFRLQQRDYDGTFAYSPEVEVTVALAETYRLSAGHPNPFSTQAYLTLAVARAQPVVVTVYDLLGREVARLYDGVLPANRETRLVLEGQGRSSGVYVVVARGTHFAARRSVMLVR